MLFVRAGLFEHGAKPKPCGGRGRWDLLSLARSSATGQGVLVLLDGLDPLHRLESLEHGIAVQVIDLVLQAHAEQVARGLIANQVGVQVIRLDDDMVGTLDLAANAGDGQAALAKRHQMIALLNNDGIDEHVRIVVVLVAVIAVDGDELDELANLRGSQAAATVLEHHLLHLLGKRLDRRGDLLDDGALLAQTRVGRQYDSVARKKSGAAACQRRLRSFAMRPI